MKPTPLMEEIKKTYENIEYVKLKDGELDGDIVFANKGSETTDIASPTKKNVRLVYKRTKTFYDSTIPVFRFEKEIKWKYEITEHPQP